MLNSELYFKEVDELINVNKNLDRIDFELLYEAVTTQKLNIDAGFLADKIAKKLSGAFYQVTMISWEFLNTEVGKALLKAKFEIGQDIYFMADLAEMLNCSRQNISKEIRNEKIKKRKKGGIVYFMESDVREYLLSKNKMDQLDQKREITYKKAKEKIISKGFERENCYLTNKDMKED